MQRIRAVVKADPVGSTAMASGVALAIVSSGWTAYFLRNEPRWAMLAVPLVAAGIAGLGRRPPWPVALVAAAGVLTWLCGVSWGNVDLVLPYAIALYVAGRHLPPWPGAAMAAVCIASSALRDDPGAETALVATCLFGSMWAFGRLVNHRAVQAHASLDRAWRLSRADPVALGVRHAREERARLANEALTVVRNAVMEMQSNALGARESLAQEHLDLIRERGACAVTELRQMLGLLRNEAHPQAPAPNAQLAKRSATPTRSMSLIAAIAVIVVLILTHPQWDRSLVVTGLHVGTLIALLLAPRARVGAAAVLTGATLLTLAQPPQNPESLLPAAVAGATFTWWCAAHASRRQTLALVAAPALASIVVAVRYGDTAIAFMVIVFVLPLLAGRAWGERDRILRQAQLRSEQLQSGLDTAVASAVRQERLRLARELHDVTGHAISVMVIHAGAASVTRESDPHQARQHVHTAWEAGSTALSEIHELFDVLGGVTTDEHELHGAVTALVEAAEQSGRAVRLTLAALPNDPAVAVTIYRIVQEAVTNALRHSSGGIVTIEINRVHGGHRVSITDSGLSTHAPTDVGFGLVGLRERVQVHGGRFNAGPLAGGGFVVEATLPGEAAC